MASTDRDLAAPWRGWYARLTTAPASLDFVDVVDLLQRLSDTVHLRHSTGLGFSRGEIEAITLELADGKPTATVVASFFGLAGETSPLPLGLVEEADRDDDHGATVRGLLDLFSQRMLRLWHLAVTGLDYPHVFKEDGSDPWTRAILALLGVADRKTSLTPGQLLRLAPILATGVRSPEMLEAGLRIALEGWLDQAAIRCSPFTGDWMEIDRPEWSRLGGDMAPVSNTAVLGTTVLHRAGGAQVNVGPLSGDAYRQYMPGGPAHARTQEFMAAFLSAPVEIEMVLEVVDMTYPPGRLGERRLADDLWLARSGKSGLATQIKVPLKTEEVAP